MTVPKHGFDALLLRLLGLLQMAYIRLELRLYGGGVGVGSKMIGIADRDQWIGHVLLVVVLFVVFFFFFFFVVLFLWTSITQQTRRHPTVQPMGFQMSACLEFILLPPFLVLALLLLGFPACLDQRTEKRRNLLLVGFDSDGGHGQGVLRSLGWIGL